MTSARLILVFARSPADESRAKPLGRSSSTKRAEALHRALLDRTLAAAARVPGVDLRLVTTGDLAAARRAAPAIVFGARLAIEAQEGASLSARLARAVERGFADGYQQVIVVGGDTPGLRTADLEDAFERLAGGGGRPSAVIGPARDGGYYLLGLGADAPSAFDPATLGTDRACAGAERALAAAGFLVERLVDRDDVDTAHDLARLASQLRGAASTVDRTVRRLALALLARPHDRLTLASPLRAAPHHRPADARGPPVSF